MSEASDGYSEDFDEEIHSDPDSKTPYSFKESKTRQKTPALLLNRPEGRVKEMTMERRNRQVANRGANSLPILGRGSDREVAMEQSPMRLGKKRMVSHDAGKLPNNRVLSSNLRAIRSLQSALKEKELLVEQLVKENRLYKRFDILAQKEVSRIEREHKNLPELIKHHEVEMALQKERYKKLLKGSSDTLRRKEHLEKELTQCKAKLTELKKISENRYLEERHMLSLHLQEELNRNQLLTTRLQETERKLTMQGKTTKRDKAELEDRCKKKEKRISLMEENLREIDFEMRTKQKQLDKLNLYSQRIDKNLPPNMNISDLLPSQEDRCVMTSPSLLEYQLPHDRGQTPVEELFTLPPTRSQAQSSNSTNYTRVSFHRQMQPDTTHASETSIYPKKHHYDIASALYTTMTHSEAGNYSESDTMPTLHTSSDLTSLTTHATSIEAKSASDLVSPPMPHDLPDPPLSAIREVSSSTNKSPLKAHSPRMPVPHTNTQSNQLQQNFTDNSKPKNQQIDSTKKEMLLQRLKQIDSSSTNPSLPTDSLTSRKSQSDRQPDNLEMPTHSLPQGDTYENDTPVNLKFDSDGNKGKKKKTFALDDLFSSSSAQSSETKLHGSNMDPSLFSAPKQDSPFLFTQEEQKESVPQEQELRHQQNLSSKVNHFLGEETHEMGRKPSVVENMYLGKPAFSTEDDFYGSKQRKASPNKTSHAFLSEKSQGAQHGRRARETNSPTHTTQNYFWENSVAANSEHKPSAPPVDDVDEDLEVIQL